jgi:integrase
MATQFKVRAANGKRGIVYLRWRTWWLDARSAGGTRVKLEAGTEEDAHQAAEAVLTKIDVDNSLGAALEDYCALYRKSKRPSTVLRTIPTLEAFVEHVGPDISAEALRQDHVQAYVSMRGDCLNPRTKEKIKRITIMNEVACIRTFTRVLQARGLLLCDPCLKIQYPEGKGYDPNSVKDKAFTVEETTARLEACNGSEFAHDWIVVGTTVGLRPQEQSHARGIDLDEKAGVLHVRGSGGWMPKNQNATRSLELAPEALAVLSRRKLALKDKALTLFHAENEKCGLIDLHNVRAKIVRALGEGLPFGLYRLRHTFGVRAREAGWSLEEIAAYMGHSSVKVAEIYAKPRSLSVGAPPVSTLARSTGKTSVNG